MCNEKFDSQGYIICYVLENSIITRNKETKYQVCNTLFPVTGINPLKRKKENPYNLININYMPHSIHKQSKVTNDIYCLRRVLIFGQSLAWCVWLLWLILVNKPGIFGFGAWLHRTCHVKYVTIWIWNRDILQLRSLSSVRCKLHALLRDFTC